MNRNFAFGKENFIWIGCAVVLIVIGFILMSGGGSPDGVSFNPSIFSKQRIAVAPAMTMIGFLLMVAGILKNGKDLPKDEKSLEDSDYSDTFKKIAPASKKITSTSKKNASTSR
jgi:uncharacterized membrane protein